MLSAPPRNSDGEVQPHDHKEIKSTDQVIRLLSQYHIVDDGNTGKKRVSTAAYQASSTGSKSMSVDLKELMEANGLDPKEVAQRKPWLGSVLLNVGFLRTNNFQVGYDPLSTNAFHGGVWGAFTKGAQKKLIQNHTIFTWPSSS